MLNKHLDARITETFASACVCHKQGDFDRALEAYSSLWSSFKHLQAGVNAASILRTKGRQADAVSLLKDVLAQYTEDGGGWGNLANNYLDLGNPKLAIPAYLKAISLGVVNFDILSSLINAFRQEQLDSFALRIALAAYHAGYSESAYQIIEILSSSKVIDSKIQDKIIPELVTQALEDVANFKPGFKSLQKSIFLSNALVSLDKLDTAHDILTKTCSLPVEPQHLQKKWQYINNIHWNLANKYLHVGNFGKGWSLYDAGLLVKAEGKQKYQRSLLKPFNNSQVTLWTGQNLTDKKILVLAEQGIGDTMMFAVILENLFRSSNVHVYFVPGDRLVRLYRESFASNPNITILKSRDAVNMDPSRLDYMTPVGSLLNHFWKIQSQPYLQSPIFKANSIIQDQLRKKYDINPDLPTLGISWRGGGGKKKRILSKSIELPELLKFLPGPDQVNIISLQYGDTHKYIQSINSKYSANIISDPEIDAVTNMYSWISQVSLCDCVVSVANTTVHGSGGLCIPTLCLVGQDYDWRWVRPELGIRNSYWYGSVEAHFKSDASDWTPDLLYVRDWARRMLHLGD